MTGPETAYDREKRVLLLIADGEVLGPDDEPTVADLAKKLFVQRGLDGSIKLTRYGQSAAAFFKP